PCPPPRFPGLWLGGTHCPGKLPTADRDADPPEAGSGARGADGKGLGRGGGVLCLRRARAGLPAAVGCRAPRLARPLRPTHRLLRGLRLPLETALPPLHAVA